MEDIRSLRHPVWTENKAQLIARYLELFTYVTHHGTYIDGFAGPQSEVAEQGWAAELVLAIKPRRLRRFYLCDNDDGQVAALRDLAAKQPPKGKNDSNRTIEVIPGDFNETVTSILGSRKLDSATFCLLDQRTFECRWSTVEAVARHRGGDKGKIEIFYFLPIGWLNRSFIATTKNHADIDAWWGRGDWLPLVDMSTVAKAIAFQKRFQELGYKYVHPFPIFENNGGGRIMFYMILATDHAEAPKLMWRAYDQAVAQVEGWQQLSLDGVPNFGGAVPRRPKRSKRRGRKESASH